MPPETEHSMADPVTIIFLLIFVGVILCPFLIIATVVMAV